MELREYWAIVARRWPLIGVVTILTFAASLYMVWFGPTYYKSELRLAVSIKPEPAPPPGQKDYYTYDRYYTWLTAEYLVDDLGEVIRSDAFLKEVSQRLGGMSVGKEAIRRDLSVKKTHRILTIVVTTQNPHTSFVVANAIKETLDERAHDFFAQLDSENAVIQMLDDPVAEAEMGTMRKLIEIGLRTIVAFLAAIGLAFLLHYLDPTVRDSQEAERLLGLPVLAELP
ncbi:MAG: YveK family protein [Sphingomonadaceae bacterium]